jgi:hypothetical protein
MERTPCKNKRLAKNPITIYLPDRKKVTSMHICNITIPSLPFRLVGHIAPEMKKGVTAWYTGIMQGRLQSYLQ